MKRKQSNKKGFTLVELLAVIVLLGIISTVAVVSFNSMQEKSKKEYYDKQRELIILSAKDYFTTNRSELPKEVGTIKSVSLTKLIDDSYIDNVISYDKNECTYNDSNASVVLTDTGTYSYNAYLVCGGEKQLTDHVKPQITYKYDKNFAKSIKVNINVTDVGSGLTKWEYTIIKNDVAGIMQTGLKDKTKELILEEDGVYTIQISAYDAAGNQTTITTDKLSVDRTNPTCVTSGGSATWTNKDIKLIGTCSDVGNSSSGCKSPTTELIFTKSVKGEFAPPIVEDKAGNTAICPLTDVSLDKDMPVISSLKDEVTLFFETDYDLMKDITIKDEGGSLLKETTIKDASGKIVKNARELPGGKNQITYTATDNALNITTKVITYNIEYRYLKDVTYGDNACIKEGNTCYYQGNPVANYVNFGGDTFRVVSRLSDGTVKAIRKDVYNVGVSPSSTRMVSGSQQVWVQTCSDGSGHWETQYYNYQVTDRNFNVLTNFIGNYASNLSNYSQFLRYNTWSYGGTAYGGLLTLEEFNKANANGTSFLSGSMYWLGTSNGDNVYVVNNNGTELRYFGSAANTRPVIVYKDDVKINGGKGTASDPWTLTR